MKILHTSDWHLGRTLHKVSLADAQRDVMDQICRIAADEQVDLVVISGDVFDHVMPSAESLELLEEALVALLKLAPVVLTAGNHDSLRRLGYGSKLFADNLHVRTRMEDVGGGVDFADEHGTVRVYPIPYLHPESARHVLADDEELEASHTAVLSAAMDRVRADLAAREPVRSVVLAHAWVAGGSNSDSERDISVGGLGTVGTDVFAGVDYVALGHLHGPQEPTTPDGRTRLRYSGSPLRYSFSEVSQEKSVTIVEIGPDGVDEIRTVGIEQPRGMAVLRGTMEELLDPANHTEAIDCWVSAVVTDDARPSKMWPRIKERFGYALAVQHEPASGFVTSGPRGNVAIQTPAQVAAEFVQYVTNGEIQPGELAAFDKAVQKVKGAQV